MSVMQASFKKLLLLTFTVAFPFSFVWEMVQMFAYAPFGQSTAQTWLFCGLASIADSAYITALYWLGKYFTRNDRWIAHLTWRRIIKIAIVGIISATVMERIALTFRLWQYSDAMIRLPVLQVGIIPLIQLSVLPLLTFWIVKYAIERQKTPNR